MVRLRILTLVSVIATLLAVALAAQPASSSTPEPAATDSAAPRAAADSATEPTPPDSAAPVDPGPEASGSPETANPADPSGSAEAPVPARTTSEAGPTDPAAAPLAVEQSPQASASDDFRPTTPVRLVDSRIGRQLAAKIPAGSDVGVTLGSTEPIPAGATAATMNVTVTQPEGNGYLVLSPCTSEIPLASHVNFTAGQTVANQVTVQLGDDGVRGDVCIRASVSTHVILDVVGYYPAGTAFQPMLPARAADTRPGEPAPGQKGPIGGATVLAVQVGGFSGLPAQPPAVVLNVTITEPVGPGYATVYPCDQPRPLASNLNFTAGQNVANQVTVRPSGSGEVCVYSSTTTHAVADLNGWYADGTGLVARSPVRLADTRPGESAGWSKGRVPAGRDLVLQVLGVHGVPNDAGAVVLNVTVTAPVGSGWLSVYPCEDGRPEASSLNYTVAATVPNAVTMRLGPSGTICIATLVDAHVVVDLGGHFAGEPRTPEPEWRFFRASTSEQVYTTTPEGHLWPVSGDQLAALGSPPVFVEPVEPGEQLERAQWSPSVYSVVNGRATVIDQEQYLIRGAPPVQPVLAVTGTDYQRTSNSSSVYQVAPDGAWRLMSHSDWAAVGSPAARVVVAAPGSRFVKTENWPHVYAMAPDGTTRHITAAEYDTLGRPTVETLHWRPLLHSVSAAELWASYRWGCPVGPSSLVRIEAHYWDFAGRLHTGSIVVARGHAGAVEAMLRSAFDAHFPLQQLTPVEAYGGNDEASMAAGNTSAFNCRSVVGNPSRLSQHSYGNAVDVNPAQNPYVTSSSVYPPGSDTYLDRNWRRPGMIYWGDPIQGPLGAAGWLWGARWYPPDYHHFSSNGG